MREADPTVLLRLVNDLRVLRSAWEREPIVSTGLGDFADVFCLRAAERLLCSALPVSAVRIFRDGRRLPADAVARIPPGRRGEPVVDGARLADRVAGGATVVLEDLQTHSAPVAAFAREVALATGYGTYCAAFLTPARARGVAPHYDTASVFIRQVRGSKRWRVGAPERPWPAVECGPGGLAEPAPVLDVVLREGDCLYLPRGFVHVGDATDEASVHLSVAVLPTTWGAVLADLVRAAAEESAALREALPPRFAQPAPDGAALARARLRELTDWLARRLDGGLALDDFRPAAPEPPGPPGHLVRALEGGGPPAAGPPAARARTADPPAAGPPASGTRAA